jgi:hypothetical protein
VKYLVGPMSNIEGILQKIAEQVEKAQAQNEMLDIEIKPHESSRSAAQNRTQFMWYMEAATQGDMTAQEYRAYCKLHFGVPILRAEDEQFRAVYDKVIRPLEYESKMELMMEPIDFPVTSRMTWDQKSQFLDKTLAHFKGLGFQMTEPEWENM